MVNPDECPMSDDIPEMYFEKMSMLAVSILTCADADDFSHHNVQVLAEAYITLLGERGYPPKMKCHPSIQLRSGIYFDFTDPHGCIFDPEDIAYALSKIARFNGHNVDDMAYPVGQHCCLACDYAEPEYKFEALMHDSPEFVLGDVTTPLKQLLGDYQAVEHDVTYAMATQFGFPTNMSDAVKAIDLRMARTEQRDLMPDTHDEWELLKDVEPYPEKIVPWTPEKARIEWLHRFHLYNPNKE